MSETRPKIREVTCPSGLKGVIRKLKVSEENLLANPRKARDGAQMNAVLAAIWEETIDPGPYTIENGKPDFGKILMGDQMHLILQMRILTFTKDFPFDFICRNELCKALNKHDADLETLEVQLLPEESRTAFQDGNRFTTTVNGRKVVFKLLLADATKHFAMVRKRSEDQLSMEAIRAQIVEVEGLKPREIPEWINDLYSDDAADLRELFERSGCGVHTNVQIPCTECGNINDIELPFGNRDFFSRPKISSQM